MYKPVKYPGDSIRYWIRSDLVGSDQPIKSDRIPGNEIASDPVGIMPRIANFTRGHLSSIRLWFSYLSDPILYPIGSDTTESDRDSLPGSYIIPCNSVGFP